MIKVLSPQKYDKTRSKLLKSTYLSDRCFRDSIGQFHSKFQSPTLSLCSFSFVRIYTYFCLYSNHRLSFTLLIKCAYVPFDGLMKQLLTYLTMIWNIRRRIHETDVWLHARIGGRRFCVDWALKVEHTSRMYKGFDIFILISCLKLHWFLLVYSGIRLYVIIIQSVQLVYRIVSFLIVIFRRFRLAGLRRPVLWLKSLLVRNCWICEAAFH